MWLISIKNELPENHERGRELTTGPGNFRTILNVNQLLVNKIIHIIITEQVIPSIKLIPSAIAASTEAGSQKTEQMVPSVCLLGVILVLKKPFWGRCSEPGKCLLTDAPAPPGRAVLDPRSRYLHSSGVVIFDVPHRNQQHKVSLPKVGSSIEDEVQRRAADQELRACGWPLKLQDESFNFLYVILSSLHTEFVLFVTYSSLQASS